MCTDSTIKKWILTSLLSTILAVSSNADTAIGKESQSHECEWGCEGWWFPNFDDIFSRSVLIHPKISYQSSMHFKEDNKTYTVHVDLPGIEKKDISIQVVNNVLIIAAQRKTIEETKDKKQHAYSSYRQSVVLPENANINKIDATYKNGVVTITISKTAKKTARKILIR